MGSGLDSGYLIYLVSMARPLRVIYEDGFYHIIARGNTRQKIFLDDKDREQFLRWLKDTIETHNLICHAYCLMHNHYHLLIETPEANLSVAMRDLNGNYSQWFNARHKRMGHLFQGRFKAFVIEKETYLLEVARYIVLNPVRAKMVRHPRFWKWSSYQSTAGISKAADWLSVEWILKNFSHQKKEAERKYRTFVKEGMMIGDLSTYVENDFIVGTPQFVQYIWEKTNGSEELKDHPRKQRVVGRPTLEEIFTRIP